MQNKTIVLGVTGSIAAYKAVDVASKLVQAGARVEVIMTESATEFVTPLTFRNITGRPVVTGMFDLASEFSVEHVALAEAADMVVIAPATANIIAKIAAGIADCMLSCTVLATEAPVVIAPVMNVNMYENSITQENLTKLKNRGFTVITPDYGRLASGKMGMGRMPETEKIIGIIKQVAGRTGDFAGKRVVVTAGGTQEAIDPVRFIGNRSSGKMGYALAEAARDRGASVTLITARASLPVPAGMEVINVTSVAEMREAVLKATVDTDCLIMAAAISDFRAANPANYKIKKQGEKLTLELVENEDFLLELEGDFIKVGFAAESEDLINNARKKLSEKRLDFIAANDITAVDSGFEVDTNRITLIEKNGDIEELPLMSKREVADKILDRVVKLLTRKG